MKRMVLDLIKMTLGVVGYLTWTEVAHKTYCHPQVTTATALQGRCHRRLTITYLPLPDTSSISLNTQVSLHQ
jgi:hypothetical protein